jgi:hypothetical protein
MAYKKTPPRHDPSLPTAHDTQWTYQAEESKFTLFDNGKPVFDTTELSYLGAMSIIRAINVMRARDRYLAHSRLLAHIAEIKP